MYGYRYTPPPETETTRRAEDMAALVKRHLDVRFAVRWFEPCALALADFTRENNVSGLYRAEGNEVLVRAGMDEEATCRVIAHEARHAWHFRKWGKCRALYMPGLEIDANRYEGEALSALNGAPSRRWASLRDEDSVPIADLLEADLHESDETILEYVLWGLIHYGLSPLTTA